MEPPNPWNRSFRHFRSNANIQNGTNTNSYLNINNGSNNNLIPNQQETYNTAPPIPPRHGISYNSSNNHHGMYSPYSSNLYSQNQGYGMNYKPYGNYNNYENWFSQFIEDGPKEAFQSIEALVRAFSSVSMMLESTYGAVISSFQAIVGVADHLSHTKVQLGQILSAISIIRFLKKIFQNVCSSLGLVKNSKYNLNEVWNDTSNLKNGLNENDLKQNSTWPLIIFFSVVFGGPWLIWKFLNSFNSSVKGDWKRGQGEHYIAIAEHDFIAANNRELCFKRGEKLRLAPKERQPRLRGWLLASLKEKSGLVPANYIKIQERIVPDNENIKDPVLSKHND